MSRWRSSRGAAVVEMALVGMFMLTVVAGALDFGLGWHSGMAVTEAARTGARVGSGQANSLGADRQALSGVSASLKASGKLSDVELVVLYRSASDDGEVPTACLNASGGQCSVFTGDQLRSLDFDEVIPDSGGYNSATFDLVWDDGEVVGGTGCARSGYAQRTAWCPSTRVAFQEDEANYYQGDAPYLGIYIRYRQDHLFPQILGDDTTITRSAVMRLEPPS